MANLFDPLVVGDLTLPNRIIMAPLTRLRAAGGAGVPNALMAEYYAQRAAAGLIISEGVPVMPSGVGYLNVPGIWTDAQTDGWKRVTEAVHEAGGRIVMQIWHVGRISDPMFHDGAPPVSASAIAAGGDVSLLRPKRPFVTPRALERDEVKEVVDAYGRAARNARIAGFDGVELHGANGYLLDQFLQDGSNKRDDEYGGPIENRARLMLEAADAAIAAFGAGRVGMHLAPRADAHSMGDSDLKATFTYVAEQLAKRKIAFICAREYQGADSLGPHLRRVFGGVYIANEGFTKESAEAILAKGDADAVAFGKGFIANPDLVRRFAENAPLNALVPETIYAPDQTGYTDYPALEVA